MQALTTICALNIQISKSIKVKDIFEIAIHKTYKSLKTATEPHL